MFTPANNFMDLKSTLFTPLFISVFVVSCLTCDVLKIYNIGSTVPGVPVRCVTMAEMTGKFVKSHTKIYMGDNARIVRIPVL